MYKMKRYQVYLNPHSVAILDDVQKFTDISKSKIIRESIDRLAQNISKVFASQKTPPKTYILDSLVGSISVKGKKKTNYAEHVDDIYTLDRP